MTPSEPDGSGQLGYQVVAVALREFDATDVVRPGGLVDVIVDFSQPTPASVARLVIDEGEARRAAAVCAAGLQEDWKI